MDEHPAEWLAPKKDASEPDLDGALAATRYLFGEKGWQVIATRIAEATLRTQASAVPEARRAEFLQGFVDGRILVAQMAGEGRQVIAFVAQFGSDADAKRFIELERLANDAKKIPSDRGPRLGDEGGDRRGREARGLRHAQGDQIAGRPRRSTNSSSCSGARRWDGRRGDARDRPRRQDTAIGRVRRSAAEGARGGPVPAAPKSCGPA